MSTLPDAPAVCQPSRRMPNRLAWVVRCPYCSRRHAHASDPGTSEVIVTAGCDRTRFYRLVVAEQVAPGA